MSGFSLEDWISSKPEAYELTQAQIDELQALVAPAAAKCGELNIPFIFAYQAALAEDGLACSFNGCSGSTEPGRTGPNALLNHLLMNREDPQTAVDAVSYAVHARTHAAEAAAPSIILPN